MSKYDISDDRTKPLPALVLTGDDLLIDAYLETNYLSAQLNRIETLLLEAKMQKNQNIKG